MSKVVNVYLDLLVSVALAHLQKARDFIVAERTSFVQVHLPKDIVEIALHQPCLYCSVLQGVAVCRRVLQGVAVCRSVLQGVAVCRGVLQGS